MAKNDDGQMKIVPHEGKRILQLSMGEESEQHQYALRRLMVGFLRLDAIQEHVETRVCVSYLSTCSDNYVAACVCDSREPTKF